MLHSSVNYPGDGGVDHHYIVPSSSVVALMSSRDLSIESQSGFMPRFVFGVSFFWGAQLDVNIELQLHSFNVFQRHSIPIKGPTAVRNPLDSYCGVMGSRWISLGRREGQMNGETKRVSVVEFQTRPGEAVAEGNQRH